MFSINTELKLDVSNKLAVDVPTAVVESANVACVEVVVDDTSDELEAELV